MERLIMSEYINREDAVKAVMAAKWVDGSDGAIAMEIAASQPAADVAPAVHGWWIERQAPHAMGGISAKCSACSKSVQYLGNPLNYCPHCGAKMDGDANHDT